MGEASIIWAEDRSKVTLTCCVRNMLGHDKADPHARVHRIPPLWAGRVG